MIKGTPRKPIKVGIAETVDLATGRVTGHQANAMTLLPPPGDACQECAVSHAWDQPHNQQSPYYQMYFHATRGRYPTWTDAMAHCAEPVRNSWRRLLRESMVSNGLAIPEDLADDVEVPCSP